MKFQSRRDTCRLLWTAQVELVLPMKRRLYAARYVPAGSSRTAGSVSDGFFALAAIAAHVQLLDVGGPDDSLRNYLYFTSVSLVFVEHFKRYAHGHFDRSSRARARWSMDIGSNEGVLLKFFRSAHEGARVDARPKTSPASRPTGGVETQHSRLFRNIELGGAEIKRANEAARPSSQPPTMFSRRQTICPDMLAASRVIARPEAYCLRSRISGDHGREVAV